MRERSQKEPLTVGIRTKAVDRSVTIMACKMRTLMGTPWRFSFMRMRGREPSLLATMSPFDGPMIQAAAPPRPPNAMKSAASGSIQENLRISAKVAKACSVPVTRLSSLSGTTMAIAREERMVVARMMSAERKSERG